MTQSAVKRHSKALVASEDQVEQFAAIFGIDAAKITSVTVNWFDDGGYTAELLGALPDPSNASSGA